MKSFSLLVNGKDVDTGVYEYFSYVDKSIVDFRNSRRIIRDIKEGKISEDSQEADEYIYAKYCVGDSNTNLSALESASKAFYEFKKYPLSLRRKIFLDMYKIFLQRKDEFIDLLIIEGHPRKLAEWEYEGMKIGSSPETIKFYCNQIQKEVGKKGNEIMYWARKPDGVICISPPGNAAASNSYNAILALLMGNTLVIKPPIRDPLSTIFLWKEVVNKALIQNGAPKGTVNIVLGNSQKIMEEWLSSDKVSDIIYFGDSNKGLDIGTRIFQSGKKPITEMSGNDILIVWKDADIEKASNSLLEVFLGSTQICMLPKIALIHDSIYNKFTSVLLDKVGKLKISLPSDPDTLLSPVAKIKEFYEFLKDALDNGSSLLVGSERVDYLNQLDPSGIFIRPTVIEINNFKNALKMRCIKEEIFFPLLPLVRFSGGDNEVYRDMINFVNSHSYGLRVSIWIHSPKYIRKFAKEIDNCGLFRINLRHVGFSYYLSTHGGTRRSGGPFGEMNYFWQKTSHLQGVSRALKLK